MSLLTILVQKTHALCKFGSKVMKFKWMQKVYMFFKRILILNSGRLTFNVQIILSATLTASQARHSHQVSRAVIPPLALATLLLLNTYSM